MANFSNRDTVQLSKTLSYLLRHGSKEKNLKMDSDGYSKLNDVLDVLSTMLPHQKITKNRIFDICLLYTSPSPRDKRQSRMPSSA